MHNTVDGITIGASFLVSNKVGIATAVAVFLHELPQEFGKFSFASEIKRISVLD